jgi:hypothetical protein
MDKYLLKLKLSREAETRGAFASFLTNSFNRKSSRKEVRFQHCPRQAKQLADLRGLFLCIPE